MTTVNFLNRQYTELTGAVHNHTEYSHDCDVKIEKILIAAKENRLDYLTLNDHHSVYPETELNKALGSFKSKKGYKPIVILGTELNDPKKQHHLLIFDSHFTEERKEIEEYLEEYEKRDSLMFAAHPYEERASNKYPLYIWEKTDLLERLDGLEIWNYASSWLSKLNPTTNGILMYLFPHTFVRKPFPKSIVLWDNLNLKGLRKSAIGSTDAHSTVKRYGFLKLKILTHKYLFGTVRTNVLLPEGSPVDNSSILTALAKGNSYIVNYKTGYPLKFYAGIGNIDGEGVSFGEEIKWSEGLHFYYHLPNDAKVILFHNGRQVAVQREGYGSFPIKEKGFYRLHVERFGATWIITNNIYVVD